MNEDIGLTYVPKFVATDVDYWMGDLVTHEAYNAILNKNRIQGDYNTEVLRKLFTSGDVSDTYHIPYIDNILTEHDSRITQNTESINDINANITDLDNKVEDLSEAVTLYDDRISANTNAIATNTSTISLLNRSVDALDGRVTTNTNSITNILNTINSQTGVPKAREAAHAASAATLDGASTAGTKKYYGTWNSTTPGWQSFPPFITATEVSQVPVGTIEIVPSVNSVEENMLTDAVKAKLNRQSITDYDDLDNRPKINSVTLTGNINLNTLGIQPAGNYLTDADAEQIYLTIANAAATYKTEAQVADLISTALIPYTTTETLSANYLTKAAAANTYRTADQVNASISTALTNVPSTTNMTTAINNAIAGAGHLTVSSAATTYLSKTDAANTYRTSAQVNTAIANAGHLTTSAAASTYLTITNASNTYMRVGVNAYPSSPKKGDLYITV